MKPLQHLTRKTHSITHKSERKTELLFLTPKKGCRVEALQLAGVKRIERALAVCLVVAWRIGLLMRLGGVLGRKGDSEPAVKSLWI